MICRHDVTIWGSYNLLRTYPILIKLLRHEWNIKIVHADAIAIKGSKFPVFNMKTSRKDAKNYVLIVTQIKLQSLLKETAILRS